MKTMKFKDILSNSDGITKGPFGGDIKKEYFVPKGFKTFKVYEQGVVYNQDINYGEYYINEERFNKLKKFEVKPGDYLLTGAGTLGELFEVPSTCEKGVINQALLRIRLNENVIDRDFFKYYFKWYLKNVVCKINGDSVIPNLPPVSVLKDTDISIPDLEEQKNISRILKNLDSKIDINNKISNKLSELSKKIYDFWFLQFEFPNEQGNCYKSYGGQMKWSDELSKEIPHNWGVKKLKEITDYQNGYAFYKDGYDEKGLRVIDLGNVSLFGTYIETSSDKFIEEEHIINNDKMAKYIVKKNDLIMIMTDRKVTMDLLGKTGKIYKNEKYLLNQRVARIRCNEGINTNYIYSTLNGTFVNNLLKSKALGSVQKYINSDAIVELPILIPDNQTIKSFEKYVDKMYEKMENNLIENEKLTNLRDRLIPMLMNGQIRYRES